MKKIFLKLAIFLFGIAILPQSLYAEMIFNCSISASSPRGAIKVPIKRLTCAAVVQYCSPQLECTNLLRHCTIRSRRTGTCTQRFDESDVPEGYNRSGATAVGSILVDEYLVRGCYSPGGSAQTESGTDSESGLPTRTVSHSITCAR